jgi:hypothetical protein
MRLQDWFYPCESKAIQFDANKKQLSHFFSSAAGGDYTVMMHVLQ